MDRYYGNEWGRKGATISDKTARLEYGLTQDEIYDAVDAGKLQYRPAAMHGNPWLRLLRREVEDLARTLHGDRDVREKQARAELARVNRELKQLRSQLAALEERRAALLSELSDKSRCVCAQMPRWPAPSCAGHKRHALDGPGKDTLGRSLWRAARLLDVMEVFSRASPVRCPGQALPWDM